MNDFYILLTLLLFTILLLMILQIVGIFYWYYRIKHQSKKKIPCHITIVINNTLKGINIKHSLMILF